MGSTIIGVETHIRIIRDLVERLTSLLETENGIIVREGHAHSVVRNPTQHEQKMGLYRRFETLAYIVGEAAKSGAIEDKELVASFLPILNSFQLAVSINNELLRVHIEQHNRMLQAVMRGIEAVWHKPPGITDAKGETVCL